MQLLVNTTLGEHRGKPRVWTEGFKLEPFFTPGQPLEAIFDHDNKRAVIRVASSGVGSFSVSRRNSAGRCYPLIELKGAELLSLFGGIGVQLRIVVRPGIATIETHVLEQRVQERTQRFSHKVATGEPLAFGSLFGGGGILDAAVHEGLSRTGLRSFNRFVVEREWQYLDAMVSNQPELFSPHSILIESEIEHVDLRGSSNRHAQPLVEGMLIGMPCTGASKAGKTKNKLSFAEEHPSAGSMFFYALQFIGFCQPYFVLMECVCDYKNSTSMAVIQNVLATWGYEVSISTLNGCEYGALEDRDRMVMVATTKGCPVFDFGLLKPVATKQSTVADILDDVPLDDESWKDYEYLAEKEVRDRAQGKGFRRVVLNGTEGKVPTIRRSYQKGGSTDPFVAHPEKPLSRLFTPSEHAKIKQIPERLIQGLSASRAHEVMGQGVVYPLFVSLGVALGQWISDIFASEKLLPN